MGNLVETLSKINKTEICLIERRKDSLEFKCNERKGISRGKEIKYSEKDLIEIIENKYNDYYVNCNSEDEKIKFPVIVEGSVDGERGKYLTSKPNNSKNDNILMLPIYE